MNVDDQDVIIDGDEWKDIENFVVHKLLELYDDFEKHDLWKEYEQHIKDKKKNDKDGKNSKASLKESLSILKKFKELKTAEALQLLEEKNITLKDVLVHNDTMQGIYLYLYLYF